MKRNYDDPNYKKFRTEVLKRDKFKCRMPNCKSKKNLNVHHIQAWSNASTLRFEPSNGITLCKKVSQVYNWKRIPLSITYSERLINGKKIQTAPEFTVIKDTREQDGYYFSKFNTCAGMIEHKLDTGDYSIEGIGR